MFPTPEMSYSHSLTLIKHVPKELGYFIDLIIWAYYPSVSEIYKTDDTNCNDRPCPFPANGR